MLILRRDDQGEEIARRLAAFCDCALGTDA